MRLVPTDQSVLKKIGFIMIEYDSWGMLADYLKEVKDLSSEEVLIARRLFEEGQIPSKVEFKWQE